MALSERGASLSKSHRHPTDHPMVGGVAGLFPRIERRGVHAASPVETPVSSAMSASLISIGTGGTAQRAKALCKEHSIHHVPVMEHGDLVGMLCSCDLWSAHPWDRVSWLMSRRVITVDACAPVDAAGRIMLHSGVGCLPVTERGAVRAVVTRGDLMRVGVPLEATGTLCASCGTHHHIPFHGGLRAVRLCLECLERSAPARTAVERLYAELGVGD